MGVQDVPPGRVIRAQSGRHSRVSAQQLSAMAKRLGRCGDIHPLSGYVCVTQPHDEDTEHMAVQIGGPTDGKVYATWGGRKTNTVMPATQQVPNDH